MNKNSRQVDSSPNSCAKSRLRMQKSTIACLLVSGVCRDASHTCKCSYDVSTPDLVTAGTHVVSHAHSRCLRSHAATAAACNCSCCRKHREHREKGRAPCFKAGTGRERGGRGGGCSIFDVALQWYWQVARPFTRLFPLLGSAGYHHRTTQQRQRNENSSVEDLATRKYHCLYPCKDTKAIRLCDQSTMQLDPPVFAQTHC